ncbi:nucleoside diphosphate kinase [Novosphingobium sp. AAP83]|uniref:GreA/GreB family elongation factor n=1 Tax=Novosphingobium sp. AAP83 TaxID=1523425 RepID=UPI0006B8D203|nr:GreA/GreB family elongation factor [Novosphingobium sp. AAP83]KPF91375.1 nucleoside diphosphate kinase [Novosphingobium sp. AAP83]
MSVAFRREGDDEHMEPKFELPIPPGPNLVTPRGLALIRARLAELEAQLPAITDEEAIKKARRELRYWGTRQSTAQLVDCPDGRVVAFGTTVSIRLGGKLREVTIVGDDEADPASGLISFSAPLSRALLDAEVGELVDFAGKVEAIEIIAIAVRDE